MIIIVEKSNMSEGQTINSLRMGRLHGKNAVVTGAAGYVDGFSRDFLLSLGSIFMML